MLVSVSLAEPVQRSMTKIRSHLPALAALLFGALGVLYRLALILMGVPGSNSDEATFGLAAKHIAEGRHTPIFLYGQHYMGVLESYLAAPLFAVFGPSWVALRIPLLVLYALFLFAMYHLVRRLYSPVFAAIVIGLLSLGSERVVRDQITAVGGRAENKVAVVLVLLLTLALASGTVRHRLPAYGMVGLLAGLALWSDWLVLPYLAAAAVVLLVASGRELWGRAGAALTGGLVLGGLPVIIYNLRAGPGEDSWTVLWGLADSGGLTAPLRQRWDGLVESVPLATGLCPSSGCTGLHQWFTYLYLALLVVAAALAVHALRRDRRDRDGRIRAVTQLALLAAAALTLYAYLRNPTTATEPLANARYLSVLQISLPAVLWPLYAAGRHSWGMLDTNHRIVGNLANNVVGVIVLLSVISTGMFVRDLDKLQQEETQARLLGERLQELGVHHVYSEYWICNRLVFNTNENVLCAVIGETVGRGLDRYPPYREQVDREPSPAFVFQSGTIFEEGFRRLLDDGDLDATVTEIGRYRLYQPEQELRPR